MVEPLPLDHGFCHPVPATCCRLNAVLRCLRQTHLEEESAEAAEEDDLFLGELLAFRMQRMLERPLLEAWWFSASEQSGHRWRQEWHGQPLYLDQEKQDPVPRPRQLAFVAAQLELETRRCGS